MSDYIEITIRSDRIPLEITKVFTSKAEVKLIIRDGWRHEETLIYPKR